MTFGRAEGLNLHYKESPRGGMGGTEKETNDRLAPPICPQACRWRLAGQSLCLFLTFPPHIHPTHKHAAGDSFGLSFRPLLCACLCGVGTEAFVFFLSHAQPTALSFSLRPGRVGEKDKEGLRAGPGEPCLRPPKPSCAVLGLWSQRKQEPGPCLDVFFPSRPYPFPPSCHCVSLCGGHEGKDMGRKGRKGHRDPLGPLSASFSLCLWSFRGGQREKKDKVWPKGRTGR